MTARFQFVLADDGVDQPGGLCAFGGKAFAQAKQGKGLLAAEDGGREQAGAGFRHQAEIDEGRAEHGARRGEGQVAMQVERRADADRDAVDAGDDRLLRRRRARARKSQTSAPPSPPVAIAMKSARSLPAENAPGTPRKTWHADRRIGVALGRAPADIASYMARVIAFFLSGRFMRMTWTGAVAFDENVLGHGCSFSR